MNQALKRPESVLIIIFTADAQVLLMERVQPEYFWQSVTGSLEPGETPRQTAERELLEETGLTNVNVEDAGIQNIYPIHPAWRHRYPVDILFNKEYVFTAKLETTCNVQFNNKEHCRYRWLNKQQALELCSSATNIKAIEMLV